MARAAAPVAEVAEEYDTERDLTTYVDKEPTAKMVDYHEWLEGVLDMKIDKQSMFLGVTLYPDFQRSEFNKSRTAARRAARAETNGAAEAEEEAPAAAPTARRGRPAKAAAAAAPAAGSPAAPKRGRGRPAKGAPAPY